jgi:hypothetical protein
MPRAVHVGLVVHKVALGQVLLKVLWFSHHYHYTTAPHSHMYHIGDWTMGLIAATIPKDLISTLHNNNNNHNHNNTYLPDIMKTTKSGILQH